MTPADAARFWAKVSVTDSSGCWIWRASVNVRRNGYGQFGVVENGKRRTLAAHRVAYELTFGAIPEGLTLDHLCRNTRCVRPAHLEPVSLAENIARTARPTCRRGHVPTGVEFDRRRDRTSRRCTQCATDRQRERRRGVAAHA